MGLVIFKLFQMLKFTEDSVCIHRIKHMISAQTAAKQVIHDSLSQV